MLRNRERRSLREVGLVLLKCVESDVLLVAVVVFEKYNARVEGRDGSACNGEGSVVRLKICSVGYGFGDR